MKLYDTLRSGNAWKVRLLASLIRQPLNRQTLSIDRGDLASSEFLRIAPLRQVPVLELPNGETLAESIAILHYLAQGTPWWPDDRTDQSRVLMWLSFEQQQHMKPLAMLRLHLSLRKDRSPSSKEFTQYRKQALSSLTHLEEQLQRQGPSGWVTTLDKPSIADIALYPYTCMAPMGDIELSPFPVIQAWLARIESLPGYEALFPGQPDRNFSTVETP